MPWSANLLSSALQGADADARDRRRPIAVDETYCLPGATRGIEPGLFASR